MDQNQVLLMACCTHTHLVPLIFPPLDAWQGVNRGFNASSGGGKGGNGSGGLGQGVWGLEEAGVVGDGLGLDIGRQMQTCWALLAV
jgi:hypothetical protein